MTINNIHTKYRQDKAKKNLALAHGIFLCILLLFGAFSKAHTQKRILLRVGADKIIYSLDVMKEYNPQADDTLVIPDTEILGVKLQKICGIKWHPIVITWQNPNRAVGGYAGYAVNINRSAYFKVQNGLVDGRNISPVLLSIDYLSQDFDIENMDLRNGTGVGLFIKTNPDSTNFALTTFPVIMRNIGIRFVRVENVAGEGAYIGHTFSNPETFSGQIPVPIINLTIDNYHSKHTGWDGLQVSNAQNVSASNIYVEDYGYLKQPGQWAGIMIGRAVTFAKPFINTTITTGPGSGLHLFGRGLLRFEGLRILNAGTLAGEHGIYISDYSTPFTQSAQQVELDSVRIEGAANAPIYYHNKLLTALPIKVHNYVFTGCGQPVTDGSHGTFINDAIVVTPPVIDTPVVVPPVVVTDDTVRIKSDYTVKAGETILFTGTAASRLTMPDRPANGFLFVLVNRGTVNLSLNKRIYFLNGQYRLMEKPGEVMWIEWRQSKKRYIITKRTF